MGKIIAVINQKGGVGKTTTAVNLAACLAYKGKKVLVVDSDPQGNATSGLGVSKDTIEYSLYDCLADSTKTKDAIIKTACRGLSIIPSLPELSAAEIELASEEKREFCVKEALKDVRDGFDFVIIDSPPALGMLTINIMTAADSILIPIQCEYYALEGLSQLVNSVKSIKKSLNPDLEIEGICATMYDSRTNLSQQVLDEVKKHFPDKVFSSPIPRNVRLAEAPSFGKPIIDYDPKAQGAKAYQEFTKEFLARERARKRAK